MKVFAIFAFAAVMATSSAQNNYQLSAPAPYQPAPQPSYQPTYQPQSYIAKPSYGPVNVGAPVPYTYPSPAPHGKLLLFILLNNNSLIFSNYLYSSMPNQLTSQLCPTCSSSSLPNCTLWKTSPTLPTTILHKASTSSTKLLISDW